MEKKAIKTNVKDDLETFLGTNVYRRCLIFPVRGMGDRARKGSKEKNLEKGGK